MRRVRSLAGLAVAGLVLTGCGGTSTSTEPAILPVDDHCAEGAITAAVKAGSKDPIEGIERYECSGNWAYAGVITPGPDGFEYTALLEWSGDEWETVDREKPCEDGSVPEDIRKAACESN